jgi:hypothetical protein
VCHVLGIVEVDEVEAADRGIQRDSGKKNGQRDPQIEPGMTRWPWFRMLGLSGLCFRS